MIYINDKTLSCINSRARMLTNISGTMLLSKVEMEALSWHFPGVGVNWVTGLAVCIPAHPFNLKITEGDDIVLEIDGCVFVPPDDTVSIPDDELTKVYFRGNTSKLRGEILQDVINEERFCPMDPCHCGLRD